jgi:hypothetical protein
MELASNSQAESGAFEQNRQELLQRLKSVRSELEAFQV